LLVAVEVVVVVLMPNMAAAVVLVVTVHLYQAKTLAVVQVLRIRCQWLGERLTP
jgi:hypothetical protein